jgi:hypothetical protein
LSMRGICQRMPTSAIYENNMFPFLPGSFEIV